MAKQSAVESAMQRAVDVLGGQTALARAIEVRQGHVWHWLRRTKRLPPERALQIENATSGEVRCEHLRPDVNWTRDSAGRVTGYQVPLAPTRQPRARRAAAGSP